MPRYMLDDLFRDVANAIVDDNHSFNLDRLVSEPGLLDRFRSYFRDQNNVVSDLAVLVQHRTEGRRTIRRADINLFANRVKGANLYLVYCDASIPVEEIVTDLTNGMVLVSFGPYSNGLEIGAERASTVEIQRSRDRAIKAARERELRTTGEENAKLFLSRLITALRDILVARGKNTEAEAIDRELTYRTYELKEIAVLCVMNDIPFESVVLRAMTS